MCYSGSVRRDVYIVQSRRVAYCFYNFTGQYWLAIIYFLCYTSSGAVPTYPLQPQYSWHLSAEQLSAHTRFALRDHLGTILVLCGVSLGRNGR